MLRDSPLCTFNVCAVVRNSSLWAFLGRSTSLILIVSFGRDVSGFQRGTRPRVLAVSSSVFAELVPLVW